MAFTHEQAEEIKKQLFAQVERLPQENKEEIKNYIENLDEEGLEEFLKKNKIQTSEKGISQENAGEGAEEGESKCIFCSIARNEIPSYKIAENKKSLAVLDINPMSKGHSIIIPSEHVPVEKLPKSALVLAQKISKKIKKKLKPEDIKIESSGFQGHAMINVIPLYKNVQLKKIKESEEELKKMQSKLEFKKRATRKKFIEKESVEDTNKLPKISFRIP
jgi:histidine triad (HIT) family protein